MKIKIESLDKHGEKICSILKENNKECYIVGGAVRDALLGKEPSDVDFATDAKPEEMKEIFENKGCAVYPTGEKFGTMTVSCDGIEYYEITTFRGEKYRRFSRKPIVMFSKSIYEDLKRRDFTINAMAYDPIEKELIDPFGGFKDIKEGVIRAVGDPRERFSEDPLRMLRMCRFSSTLGFSIDKETYDTASKMNDNLQWISAERKREELMKALEHSNKPSEFIECIVDTKLNDYVIPELYELINVEQPEMFHKYDVYEHTLKSVDAAENKEIRLAALLHDIGKPETKTLKKGRVSFPKHAEVSAEKAKKIMRRLKFSNDMIDEITSLIRYHMAPYTIPKNNTRAVMRFVRELTKEGRHMERIDKLDSLATADVIATGVDVERRVKEIEDYFNSIRSTVEKYPVSRKELAVNGNDIIEAFGIEGPVVGDTLEYLLRKVWESKVENDREELMKLAERYLISRGAIRKACS